MNQTIGLTRHIKQSYNRSNPIQYSFNEKVDRTQLKNKNDEC